MIYSATLSGKIFYPTILNPPGMQTIYIIGSHYLTMSSFAVNSEYFMKNYELDIPETVKFDLIEGERFNVNIKSVIFRHRWCVNGLGSVINVPQLHWWLCTYLCLLQANNVHIPVLV